MFENLISGSTLASLAQIWVPKFFCMNLPLLDVVIRYHHIQFQGKLKIQTQENGEKLHFGLDLGLLGPNWGRQIFL